MKTMITLFTLIGFLMFGGERNDAIFQYELDLINGETITLEEYKGEVLLIVNTASECGFTRQYSGLQELFETYSESGFKVLGFPANNFGGQEPGSDDEIATAMNTLQRHTPRVSRQTARARPLRQSQARAATTRSADWSHHR